MKENIEEDIKRISNLIDYVENADYVDVSQCFDSEDIQAIDHVISDYKRVLKENEKLKSDNLEYQRTQDIFDERKYRKKYLEERRKEQPNLLYPDADEIYERYYELKEENEKKKQKIKDILNEINKEYIKQEKIFNKHFEKENRDIQDYYIQKEATNIMQELSWIEGKLQDLLEEKGE